MSCEVMKVSWCANQGRDFGAFFEVFDDENEPVNLTEGQLYCQLRESISQKARLLSDFIAEGIMTIDPSITNRVNVNLSASLLDQLPWREGVGDVRFVKNGRSYLLFQFDITIKPSASGVTT